MRLSQSWIFAVLTLFAAAVLDGCAPKAATTPSPPPFPETAAPSPVGLVAATTPEGSPMKEAIVTRLNDFSRRLYAQAAPAVPGNLAVSPLGSFVLLDLLYEGSAGAAHEEIARVTGFTPASLGEIATLLDTLKSDQLSLAQRIFLDDKRARLVDAYLKKVGALLDEPVLVVPFSDPPRAVAVINGWVEQRTKGLIKNFLPELPPLTVAVLASVLHYKGQWAHPFPKGATYPSSFAAPAGPMKVSMMRLLSKELALIPLPRGQAVVLPHSDNTEMLLMLPDEGSTPDQFLEGLKPEELRGVHPSGDVVVELPRFEFEVETFELTPAWKALGLRATTTGADMSPMLVMEPPVPIELIVYHKTYVKVNEEGTEAAAATAVVMIPKGAPSHREEPKVIRFDRPFAFVLRDSKSGAVLMMGRVEQPTPAE